VNSAETATVVALDVGGTTIKGALVDSSGRDLRRVDRSTGAALGSSHVVREIFDLATRLVRPGTVAIGLSVPGIVDGATGLAHLAANLGWRDLPLGPLLSSRLGVPVVLEQDARAATVAEVEVGLGRGVPDLMAVVIGTGIAAGLVIGGRLVAGTASSAGELGHLPVYPGGEPCACGQRGCLEAYASAGGIARRYVAAGGSADLTVAEIVAGLDGDELGRRIWAEAVQALALALASSTLLLDPGLIVLAGGLSNAGDRLVDPLRVALQGALAWRTAPPLAVSPLGDGAGRTGAAILAWRAARQQPSGSPATSGSPAIGTPAGEVRRANI
jgi:glucokinase